MRKEKNTHSGQSKKKEQAQKKEQNIPYAGLRTTDAN